MNTIRKGLAIGVILLFIGLAFAPSINANMGKEYDKSQEIKITNSNWWWEWQINTRPLFIEIYIKNIFNETLRGNISCKFTIDATTMIFGGSINISDYYVEIEPQEQVLLYRGLMCGFGRGEAVLDMPPPINIYVEFYAFLLFFCVFLDWKD